MFYRLAFLVLGLWGSTALAGQAQQLNTAKLDSLLTALADNHQLMGSLALSHDGQVVYRRAFGDQQAAGNTKNPATAATRYRIGSVTKLFTATIIFQLIEEKKLTLTTPLATFFPQLPNAGRITIDQLLSHRSGLHDFVGDTAYAGYETRPQTTAQLLARMQQNTSDFEPGAKFAYSNSNYVVLGYVIEKLTGRTYAQALQKRIVAKAGLQNTYYGGKIDPQNHEASSYVPAAPGWAAAPETDMSIPGGAGSIVSTPIALTRFLEVLFGGKLVSMESLRQMETMRDGYGRGMFQLPFAGKADYGHNGSIDGFHTLAFYFPNDKLAVALCANAGAPAALNTALLGALSSYFRLPFKIPNFQAKAFVPTLAALDRRVGTYASPQFPLKIVLTKASGTLIAQATGQGPLTLEPVSADVFTFEPAGIRMDFDPAKPIFTLQQAGRSFVFTKE